MRRSRNPLPHFLPCRKARAPLPHPPSRRSTAAWVLTALAVMAAAAIACGGDAGSKPNSATRPALATPTPAATSQAARTASPGSAAKGAAGPGGAGLLERLPLAPESPFDVTGSPTVDGRTIADFGFVYDGAEGRQANPQPTFWAPIGTAVLAPVTGTVMAVTVVWSGDFSIMISASGQMDWVWETEHVIDVQVEPGDHVTAGQPIAVVSDFDVRNTPGVGLVELGLLEGGNPPRHHCPFLYLAPDAERGVIAQLDAMRRADEQRRGIAAPDPAAFAAPGCLTVEPIEG